MSQPIRIGDIALIIIGDQEYSLPITDIHPTYINAGDYILIPEDGRWIVQGYPTEHIVEFMIGPSSMTDIPELMMQFLLPLSHDDLMNACKTNTDFRRICQDDYFWKLKVEHDYGMVTQDKPASITYRQQYIGLLVIRDPNKAAERGRLDVLKWLAQAENVYPTLTGINLAAENGHLAVLQWLAQTKGLYPGQLAANSAASKGHLDVLKWIAQHDIYPNQLGANWAAANGHLEVLQWLAATKGLYPDQDGINWVVEDGHLEVLKWLAETGSDLDQNGINWAAGNGHLEILKWLAESGIYPDQQGANDAAAHGHLDVLEWLAQHDIYPDEESEEYAELYSRLEGEDFALT